MRRRLLEATHLEFQALVRTFIEREISPNLDEWVEQGLTPRSLWDLAGAKGLLGIGIPDEYGGSGLDDFRFNSVLVEELCRAGTIGLASSLGMHANLIAPYLVSLTTERQRQDWLPDFVTGRMVTALGMTEPNAGSDFAAIRTSASEVDGGWLINGQKTFITNGVHANHFLVAAKSDSDAGHRGISLYFVPESSEGFARGRKLSKVGQRESDTAELFFSNVYVPSGNLVGELHRGFYHLMEGLSRERLELAVMAVASCESVIALTIEHCRTREAFGKTLSDLQHVRFVLAELSSETDIGRVYVDRCIDEYNANELSSTDAAKAKYWTTELQRKVTDSCLQLHGGYGYMSEYPVARAWLDGRVQPIWGGSTETMKDTIGRALFAR
ncbi:MAG: acyl-CoA dehydrogenase family protein [Actinomycetota bacterium]|nr:acyl-CoA dehydrogenase family protein [Actinomycetota bacterium]